MEPVVFLAVLSIVLGLAIGVQLLSDSHFVASIWPLFYSIGGFFLLYAKSSKNPHFAYLYLFVHRLTMLWTFCIAVWLIFMQIRQLSIANDLKVKPTISGRMDHWKFRDAMDEEEHYVNAAVVDASDEWLVTMPNLITHSLLMCGDSYLAASMTLAKDEQTKELMPNIRELQTEYTILRKSYLNGTDSSAEDALQKRSQLFVQKAMLAYQIRTKELQMRAVTFLCVLWLLLLEFAVQKVLVKFTENLLKQRRDEAEAASGITAAFDLDVETTKKFDL